MAAWAHLVRSGSEMSGGSGAIGARGAAAGTGNPVAVAQGERGISKGPPANIPGLIPTAPYIKLSAADSVFAHAPRLLEV